MGISKKNQEYLISALEKCYGIRPVIYLKFCSEMKHAEDVCEGKLYANTPVWFRNKEIESGERGQGDKHELMSVIEFQEAIVSDQETGNILMDGLQGTLKIRYESDDKIPMVCFVGLTFRDLKMICVNENRMEFVFPFSDDEYNTMEKKFGKYCVVIDGNEFEQMLSKYWRKYGFDFMFDSVKYCINNSLDRMQAFNEGIKERFFYKDSDLSYQREFRLVVDCEIPDDHYIRIGKVSSATILNSEKLKTIKFTFYYSSHRI